MKKEIKGKVLLVTVQAKEADVNLDNGKGFRLTAGSRKAFLKVRHTFIALKKGD